MSSNEQRIRQLARESQSSTPTEEELAEVVTKRTIPGKDNDPYFEGLEAASRVVPKVVDGLNNWFEIVHVSVYGPDHIGIPMKFRWTMEKFSKARLHDWILEEGWEIIHHLNADTRERVDHEMEARYRKEVDGVTVDVNLIVEFTEDVFDALGAEAVDRGRKRQESKEEKKRKMVKWVEQKRAE